jgi:hypothetical protein
VQVDAQVAHVPTGCEIHVGRLTAMTDDHDLSRARDRSGIEVLKFNYRVQQASTQPLYGRTIDSTRSILNRARSKTGPLPRSATSVV